jgi:hypothetical protein
MRLLAAVSALVLLIGSASSASAFEISFKWCGGSSPAFSLTDVPKGTTSIMFNMVDNDAPNYRHGGGSVTYTGQASLPCGALSSFNGPSPPAGSVHTYVFTATALDAGGKTIGSARATRRFPER